MKPVAVGVTPPSSFWLSLLRVIFIVLPASVYDPPPTTSLPLLFETQRNEPLSLSVRRIVAPLASVALYSPAVDSLAEAAIAVSFLPKLIAAWFGLKPVG